MGHRGLRGLALWTLALALWLVAAPFGSPVHADHGGRNTVLDGEYTLADGERLEDNLIVFGGKAHLQSGSVVAGDVTVMGGEVLVEGTITKDLVVFGGQVELGESAEVDGDLVTLARIVRHPRARVAGNVVESLQPGQALEQLASILPLRPVAPVPAVPPLGDRIPSVARQSGRSMLGGMVRALATIILVLVVAAVVEALMPAHLGRVTRLMSGSPLLAGALGVLTLVVLAVLVPILALTIIGIPLAVVAGLGLCLGALVGWVAAGKIVGHKLLALLKTDRRTPMLDILVGSAAITLVATLPCLGPVLAVAVVCWALGAVVLTRLGTLDYPVVPYAGGNPAAAHPAAIGRPAAPTSAPQPAAPLASASQVGPRDTRKLLATPWEDGHDAGGLDAPSARL